MAETNIQALRRNEETTRTNTHLRLAGTFDRWHKVALISSASGWANVLAQGKYIKPRFSMGGQCYSLDKLLSSGWHNWISKYSFTAQRFIGWIVLSTLSSYLDLAKLYTQRLICPFNPYIQVPINHVSSSHRSKQTIRTFKKKISSSLFLNFTQHRLKITEIKSSQKTLQSRLFC